MTLLTAVLGGLVAGYFVRQPRTAYSVWLLAWAIALVGQSLVLVGEANRDDWSYWPVQAVTFAAGLLIVHLGARLRGRFPRVSGGGMNRRSRPVTVKVRARRNHDRTS